MASFPEICKRLPHPKIENAYPISLPSASRCLCSHNAHAMSSDWSQLLSAMHLPRNTLGIIGLSLKTAKKPRTGIQMSDELRQMIWWSVKSIKQIKQVKHGFQKSKKKSKIRQTLRIPTLSQRLYQKVGMAEQRVTKIPLVVTRNLKKRKTFKAHLSI